MNDLESFTNYLKVLKVNEHFYKYDPLAIRMEYNLDSDTLGDAYMCHTIFHSVRVFEEYELFRNLVLGLNNRTPDFKFDKDVSPAEICWALKVIRTFLDPKTPFNDEVLTYIASELYQEGFFDCSSLEIIQGEKSIDSGLTANELLAKFIPQGCIIPKEAVQIQKEAFDIINDYVDKRFQKQQEEIRGLR